MEKNVREKVMIYEQDEGLSKILIKAPRSNDLYFLFLKISDVVQHDETYKKALWKNMSQDISNLIRKNICLEYSGQAKYPLLQELLNLLGQTKHLFRKNFPVQSTHKSLACQDEYRGDSVLSPTIKGFKKNNRGEERQA